MPKEKNAARINQRLIVANEERLNGAPVFVDVEDSSQCMCIAADGDWVVQPVEYKGTNRCYAHIKDKISPLDPAAQWMLSSGDFENQSVRVKKLNYDLQGFYDWKEVACSHTDSSLSGCWTHFILSHCLLCLHRVCGARCRSHRSLATAAAIFCVRIQFVVDQVALPSGVQASVAPAPRAIGTGALTACGAASRALQARSWVKETRCWRMASTCIKIVSRDVPAVDGLARPSHSKAFRQVFTFDMHIHDSV